MIKKTFLFFIILICSLSPIRAEDKGVVFDPDTSYDVYFSAQGESSFVLRRVKILEQNWDVTNPYIVVKSDRSLTKANRGYVFMKSVHTIVPSDYFQIEGLSGSNKN